jgi:adenosylhomocysteine nucleosidase
MSIVVIGAMPEEISALAAALTDLQHQQIASVDFYTGNLQSTPIVLVKSGVGKVHAALAATLTIQLFNPRCIINVGTAGAMRAGLAAGSAILFESIAYHDVDVTGFGYEHGQIPRMPANFLSEITLLQVFENHATALDIKFHKGMGLTGDQFIADSQMLAGIKEKFPEAIGIDMESAAIAQVAHLFNVPFVAVRGISDHANEASPETFKKNLDKASNRIAELLIAAINELGNHYRNI